MKPRAISTLGALFAGALMASLGAVRADVIRYPIPNSTFPIAQAVQVPGNATTYYVSGQVPPVVSKETDPSSPQAFGDTKTQTVGVLNKIKAILEGLGLGMADVVKMQVFLVHDARAPMDVRRWISRHSWRVTRSFLAAVSPICRHGLLSASHRSPIPDFWSKSK